MASSIFIYKRCHNLPNSSWTFTCLWLIFVALTLLNVTEANTKKHKTTTKHPKHNCAVCDSLAKPNCSRDDSLEKGFNVTCESGKIWCFKAEGRVRTFNSEGETALMRKVVRGCAKPYFDEACVHIKQGDGTNFKVCYCKNVTCNWNYTVKYKKVKSGQGRISSTNSGNGLRELAWLISLLLTSIYWGTRTSVRA